MRHYLCSKRVVHMVMGVYDGLDRLVGDVSEFSKNRHCRLHSLCDVHDDDAVLAFDHDGVAKRIPDSHPDVWSRLLK